jgi:hypothetical protein
MRYTVDRHYYSYFGGADKHEYKSFTNLQEAWHAYKCEKANDFNYGDAWQFTSFRVIHDYSATLKPQRPHSRSAQEWRRMVWDKEEALQRERMTVSGIEVLFMDTDDDLVDDIDWFADFVDDGLPF